MTSYNNTTRNNCKKSHNVLYLQRLELSFKTQTIFKNSTIEQLADILKEKKEE